MTIKIIGRRDWGARAPKAGVLHVSDRERSGFMVHHSGGPADQSPAAIQAWCMDGRGFKDVDYNFLVDQHGHVYEGRGWTAIGSHCIGQNTACYGVCVIGKNQLSEPARDSLRDLYRAACRRADRTLTPLVHSDRWATGCPGRVIRGWVHSGGLGPHRDLCLTDPPMHGDDVARVQRIVGATVDGVFGPRTEGKVIAWQRKHELVADGVVGPKTRAKMGL